MRVDIDVTEIKEEAVLWKDIGLNECLYDNHNKAVLMVVRHKEDTVYVLVIKEKTLAPTPFFPFSLEEFPKENEIHESLVVIDNIYFDLRVTLR